MKNNGYTLIELLVVISLLVIVMVGGTNLFLSNLRSSGTSEAILRASRTARTLAETIETRLRFGKIVTVGEQPRETCLTAGTEGVSGPNVVWENLNGSQEMLSWGEGAIASSAADGSNSVRLNSEEIVVTDFAVKWYCLAGINDKMKIDMSFEGSGTGLKTSVSEKISREFILLNSGL